MAVETIMNQANLLTKYNWVFVPFCLGDALVSTVCTPDQ